MVKTMIVAVTLAAVSCGLSELGEDAPVNQDGGIWGGPVEDNGGAGTIQQICYLTALDYQKGYNWRADQERETVRCSLIVYADGHLVMKIPVGEEYETGADPDMHRIIDGHLYTDYPAAAETVIKKDGNTLFRYPGAETLRGMKVSEDDVYTLGQDRNGNGFSYRKNGETIISRENGHVIGTLNQSGDLLTFSFYEKIRSAEGEIGRYYVVRNGTVTQTALRDDIKKVWDIMPARDTETYVASLVGVASPVLFTGGEMSTISLPKNANVLSVSLFGTADSPGAEIMYASGGAIYCSIWQNGRIVITFPKNRTISSLCCHENGVCCAINPASASSNGLAYRCGELHEMPEGYSCVGSDAICMVNGILRIGLSSYNGSGPVVWKDGETETLKINGYIASISAH